MEEKQIRDFVHRVSTDEVLRTELTGNPDGVLMREGFSPRVARVILQLVPHLTADQTLEPSLAWWGQ